ncbi:putative polyprotein [Panicum miliaceum]|uniref:Polyprotein n=1 Tax=Panicum miliaceum TaxID=4540 RepID=A0A3L6TEZ5_PANMI|nr:putative polyprotein [Panicum miliaceum]
MSTVTNFSSSFNRPGTRGDLLAVKLHKGELLRQYIQRFSQVRNTIPRITPSAVIMAFTEGVTNKRLVGKLETRNVETVSELFVLADKCAQEVEAQQRSERRGVLDEPAEPEHTRSGQPDNKKNKRKAATILAAVEGRNKQQPGRAPGGGAPRPGVGFQNPAPAKPGAGKWSKIHRTDRHDLTECRLVKGLAEDHRKERGDHRPDGDGAPEEAGLGFQEARQAVTTIFGGATAPPSRRRAKVLWREVCAVSPAPESSRLMKWSGTPITFDRNDHLDNMAGVGLLPVHGVDKVSNLKS